jgi:zinc transporter ZupT
MENVLAFVAGIMMMVALCDLFPEAKRHDSKLYFAAGTITGVIIMAATEFYLPS